MARKKHRVEQVINKLREAEVELAKGQTVRAVCRKLGVSEHTYYRWRREYGGLKLDHAKRLKELEKENSRLKRVVADQALDIAILKEAANPNFPACRQTGEPVEAEEDGGPRPGRTRRLRAKGLPRAGAAAFDAEAQASRAGRRGASGRTHSAARDSVRPLRLLACDGLASMGGSGRSTTSGWRGYGAERA